VRTLSALRQEVETDSWILSHGLSQRYSPAAGSSSPTSRSSPPPPPNSILDAQLEKKIRQSATVHDLQRQIDTATSSLDSARESLRLQQLRYGENEVSGSMAQRLSMNDRLLQHRSYTPLDSFVGGDL